MSFIKQVTAAISKFRESTDHDPALEEVLTQILEALKQIEGRFEALGRPKITAAPQVPRKLRTTGTGFKIPSQLKLRHCRI